MAFVRTEKALENFAKEAIKRARLSLKTQRTYESIRASWSGGVPYNIRRFKKKGNKYATGRLYKSLQYDIQVKSDTVDVGFDMEPYGQFVDQGRSPRRRMPPEGPILAWMRTRKILNRGEGGRFVRGSLRSIAFRIRRKIGWFGIKPTYFFSNAYDKAYNTHEDLIMKAYADDVEKSFYE